MMSPLFWNNDDGSGYKELQTSRPDLAWSLDWLIGQNALSSQ